MARRLYGLFFRVQGKLQRRPGRALPKDQAVRVYQSRLLDASMMGLSPELRPVTQEQEDAFQDELSRPTRTDVEYEQDIKETEQGLLEDMATGYRASMREATVG